MPGFDLKVDGRVVQKPRILSVEFSEVQLVSTNLVDRIEGFISIRLVDGV